MLALSQSFSMGQGSLEHNLRIKKDGKGIRQNGYKERRHLNEHVIVRGDITQPNYEANLLRKVVKEKIGEELARSNERKIQKRHPEQVMTIDDWIKSKQYTRSGKQKKLINEYVINLGNRHTACPYVQQKDADGNLLDKHGKIIPLWDTRRAADYKDGKVVESAISKKLKPILKDFVQEFAEANPQAEILGYSIHCDEGGAVHAHLSVLWWSKMKPIKGRHRDITYGIAETSAIRQQYEARGITCGDERYDNPQNSWRKEMRQLLREVAYLHGVDRLDMGNKEPHRSKNAFGRYKDKYCEELEAEHNKLDEKAKKLAGKEEAVQAKEQEIEDKEKVIDDKLTSNIAKKEWYLLKTKHPDLYNKIHEEFLKEKKNLKNVLDKQTNVCYHRT